MDVLLDTRVLLWTLTAPDRLGGSAKAVLADPQTRFLVSAATLWEIAIKQALGHLRAPEELPDLLEAQGFLSLPVRAEHAWRVRSLPLHHRDPFDRLLVAQAQVEKLCLVTHDRRLERYDVRIIRA